MAATTAAPSVHRPVPAAPGLPPGPSMSGPRQALAWILRPEALLERARRECEEPFSIVLPIGPVVVVSDPADIKRVFTGDPAVLRAGEGNAPLEPAVGPESLLLLDGSRHLRRRKLVLPPFHGERLARHAQLIERIAASDVERWPVGEPFALEPRMRAITLEVILRIVFGIEDADRLAELQRLYPELLPPGMAQIGALDPEAAQGPRAALALRGVPARARRRSTGSSTTRSRAAALDERLDEHDDILSMLVAARDEDGEPLTDQELRDELMTLLLAGHETTATALSWAFELLHRHPAAMARAQDEARSDAEEAPYIEAVATETLRVKPPLPMVVRRLAEDFELGGRVLPAGTRLAPSIFLAHRRPELYPAPNAFRPERFLGQGPETYAWLPFGGGTRRCVGASFAQLEMRIVLRAVLRDAVLRPASGKPERTRRRAIVLTPEHGARSIRVS